MNRCSIFVVAFAWLLPIYCVGAQDTIPPRRPPLVDSTIADSVRRPPEFPADSLKAAERQPSTKASTKTRKTTRRASTERPDTSADEIERTWPKGPDPLPGSILPEKRIIAFYGNPLSKRMGILGQIAPDSMLAQLDREVAAWSEADTLTPVQPALHLIAVVAQADAGRDGKYRLRMDSAFIERVYSWAQRRNALLFLDLQLAHSTLAEEMRRLTPFLKRPDVHLGIDPEFAMKRGGKPGQRIGTLDARDVNEATAFLAELVTANQLPPKVLVIHRFTKPMLTNYDKIVLDPRVQVVIHMDGWGPPWMKRESYRRFVAQYPVQYTGFKLFYRNDTKGGSVLMKPKDVLALWPKPMYIQYQ